MSFNKVTIWYLNIPNLIIICQIHIGFENTVRVEIPDTIFFVHRTANPNAKQITSEMKVGFAKEFS